MGCVFCWGTSFANREEGSLRMGLGLSLAFVLICHVLPLPLSVSAEEGSKSTNATCEKQYHCGNLAGSSFPSFDPSHLPGCGFFMLHCEAKPLPQIAFDSSPWPWFSVINESDSAIRLRDDKYGSLLASRSCDVFDYGVNMLPKSSPSISYSILPNITLYRCPSDPATSQLPADDIIWGYQNYECDDVIIIYPQDPVHPAPGKLNVDGTIHAGCKNVTLPMMFPRDDYSNKTDLFQLLTPEFDLEWHLSDDCYTCDSEGHECRTHWSQPVHALCAKKGKNKLRVILCTVITVSAIVIVLALLFIWRRKKKMNYISHLLSRKTSEPSSNQDLEGGSIFFGVPVFSYSELEEATNSFDASKELGDGGFGTVYFGKLRDGREVAVKRLYEHNFKRMEQFMNEIQILTRLRHRNLVTLYGCTSRRCRELLLVYEYIPNGTVADHLHGDRAKDKYLTWQHRMNIAIETADALAYLHKSDIIHRDVKTNNILLDHNFCVKVADFGLSRLFPNDVSHISTAPQGTPGYVDPEYHQCYQLTDKSDVYSFGVVLIELISSMPAVDISRHRHEINLANLAINRIQRCAFDELIDSSLEYKSDTEVWRMTTSVAELAFRCLQLEKDMRPKMEEVLETLKDIQNCKDTLIDKTAETDEKAVESRRATAASPESEDIVLLKNVKSPSSPNSVADVWASGSSTTSASR